MKNFLKDVSGNVATTTAILAIPLMISAGVAIDYTSLARKNSTLQDAIDAAALAAAQEVRSKSFSEVQQIAKDFINSHLPQEQIEDIESISVEMGSDRKRLSISVNAKHDTTLLRVAGITQVPYKPETRAAIPVKSLEVALVLDTTGSMSLDGKIEALRVSATQFVEDTLELNEEEQKVTIGLVPFARHVNVGASRAGDSWLSIEANNASATWSGCVGSRAYPQNLEDSGYNDNQVPGILTNDCATAITPLTNDEVRLKNEIAALVASGSTYIPSGLTWGLRVISSGFPYNQGAGFDQVRKNNVNKVMVLMSDGENQSSINRNRPNYHNGSDLAQSDEYTQEACDRIKSTGIEIYTIGFGNNIPNATLNLLEECSTDAENFYRPVDATELSETFVEITEKITTLHLTE